MVPDELGVDWESVFLEGRRSECKVDELKKKLATLGEKHTGNKQILINCLIPYLENKFGSGLVKKEES